MPKIVFFNIPATGHVNPSLVIVAELVQRGADVIYVNSEEIRPKIEPTGAQFIAYPDLSAMQQLIVDAQDGNLPRNMRDLLRVGQDVYPFALDLVEREKPDVIMFDALANWARLVAKKKAIPSISVISTFAISLSSMPPLPPLTMLNTMRQMIQVLPSYFVDAWKFQRQYGIYSGFLLDAVMSLGAMNLVLTAKDFQPDSEKFDDTFKFVGTMLSDSKRDATIDFPFAELSDAPKVYISLGTLAKNEDFLRTCFEAFKDEAGQFILSAGKQTDISALAPIPDNFIVRNYVPQLEVLQKVDAFVTHGGLNSVHEGLTYGVPLVVVPQQPEQAIVALQVQRHGAGIALQVNPPYGNITADELRNAIRQILATKSYAENAKKVGQLLAEAGGVKRAVDEILAFATVGLNNAV